MFLQVFVNESVDGRFGVLSEVWASVAIKNTDCICVDMLQLLENKAVLAGIIGLVLYKFNAVLYEVFMKSELWLPKGPTFIIHTHLLVFFGCCFSDCSDAGLQGRQREHIPDERVMFVE